MKWFNHVFLFRIKFLNCNAYVILVHHINESYHIMDLGSLQWAHLTTRHVCFCLELNNLNPKSTSVYPLVIVSDHIYPHRSPITSPTKTKHYYRNITSLTDVVNVHQAPGRLQGHVERMLALKRSEAMDPSDEVVGWGGWFFP